MADGRLNAPANGQAQSGTSASLPFFFEPPIQLEIGDAAERQLRLASLINSRVVPRLLALHASMPVSAQPTEIHAGSVEIAELGRLILGPDNADAFNYLTGLKEAGLSIDNLYLELLEPTADTLVNSGTKTRSTSWTCPLDLFGSSAWFAHSPVLTMKHRMTRNAVR